MSAPEFGRSAPAKAGKDAPAKAKKTSHVRSVPDMKKIGNAENESTELVLVVPRPDQGGFEELEDPEHAALMELAAQFAQAKRTAKEAKAVADVAGERILAALGGRDTVQVGPWRICRADGKAKITVTEVAQ